VGGGLCAALVSVLAVLYFVKVVRTPYTGPLDRQKGIAARHHHRARLARVRRERRHHCRVKAGTKNATSASTIKWIVDDGTAVKAGDPIIELDDSGFQDDLKTKRNNVNRALADWIQAKTDYTFQEIENESKRKRPM